MAAAGTASGGGLASDREAQMGFTHQLAEALPDDVRRLHLYTENHFGGSGIG